MYVFYHVILANDTCEGTLETIYFSFRIDTFAFTCNFSCVTFLFEIFYVKICYLSIFLNNNNLF